MIAVPRRGARTLQPTALRFARLLLWLVFEVADHYRLLREVPVGRDIGKVAQEFGLTFNYDMSPDLVGESPDAVVVQV